jgi:hypothetical protein
VFHENRFLDFVSRYEGAYIKVSEAYLLIMEGLEKNCGTGKFSNMAVILSEHIALRQHIRSQLLAFMKGKDTPRIAEWRFLCLHQDSCGALVKELEKVLRKRLSTWKLAIFLLRSTTRWPGLLTVYVTGVSQLVREWS